ncbi:hypothetical protein N436_02026 [Pseudomonas sp. RV120224-01b]|nr:hypothetical protein N428_02146 [Pseudomonas sp. RV120224-01c]PYG83675.1 hypothetical protein N436_02026 [Pseudomonas sp. RV120224-01b]
MRFAEDEKRVEEMEGGLNGQSWWCRAVGDYGN